MPFENDFTDKTYVKQFQTADISHLLEQDVLLLAGSEDHYVPLEQFYQQVRALTNVRSLTGRIFTNREQAQNHCQIGNLGLALRFILNWIQLMVETKSEITR